MYKHHDLCQICRLQRYHLLLGTWLWFVLPFIANGQASLDSSFGINGKTTTIIAGGPQDPSTAALQTDGKIIVAGLTTNGTSSSFALARYNPNGTIDSSFGTGGEVLTSVSQFNQAEAVVVQSDG